MTPAAHRDALLAAHDAYQRARGSIDEWRAMEVALETYAEQAEARRPTRKFGGTVPPAARSFFRGLLAEHGMTVLDLARAPGVKNPPRLVTSQQRVLDEALLVMRSWPLSLPQLGALAHRDHSSVLVALRRAEARMAVDEVMRCRVARLIGGRGGEGDAEQRAVGG